MNNGLGLGDSLISVVAHEFEMRLFSDQRGAFERQDTADV